MAHGSSSELKHSLFLAVEGNCPTAVKECCLCAQDEAPTSWNVLTWTNEHGSTALILAARSPRALACARILLRFGASSGGASSSINYNNPRQSKQNRGTALHEAALSGSHKTCKLLLKQGAAVWKENIHGITPYEYAQQSGSSETLAMLKKYALHTCKVMVKCTVAGFQAYKPCQIVVTHSTSFRPDSSATETLLKRVYMFTGKDAKAKTQLRYSTANVHIDENERAHLVMLDPNGDAVRQTYEDNSLGLSVNNSYLALGLFSWAVLPLVPVASVLLYTHMAMTARSDYLLLTAGGRKARSCLSRGPAPPTSSVTFRPLSGSHCAAFRQLLRQLVSPGGQILDARPGQAGHVSCAGNRMSRAGDDACEAERLGEHPSCAQAAGDVPLSVQQTITEPTCVICLSEPSDRALVHAHGTSLHVCVCHRCCGSRAVATGKACPVCRLSIEGLVCAPTDAAGAHVEGKSECASSHLPQEQAVN